MTVRLAVASVRSRLGSFAGTFLTAFLAVALTTGGALLLFSVLTVGSGADRFDGVDAVVAVPRSVTLTTTSDNGSGKVKVKSKTERLTGAGELPAALVDTVAGIPGVASAVADSAFPVTLDVGGVRVSGVAHGWASASLTPYVLRAGTPPSAGQVVLDTTLAHGLRVGQTVRLTSRTGVHVFRLGGLVGGGVPAVFVADGQVAGLSGLSGPTAVGVRVARGADPDLVVAELRHRLGSSAAVYTGADKVLGDLPGAVPDYVGAVSVFGFVLGMTGFAAVFVLTGTVSFSVRRRLRELALLRTAGATPRQLRRLLGAEIAVVTLTAAAPGLPCGVVVANLIAARFRMLGVVPPQFTVTVNVVVLAAAVALGLLVTALSTAVSARRAVRIAPTQALRETAVAGRVGWVFRVVAAGVLVAVAVGVLTFVPLGGPYGLGMGFISCTLLLCAAAVLGPIVVGGLAAVVSRVVGLTGVLGGIAAAVTRAESRRVVGVAVPLTLMFAINATMTLDNDILTKVTSDQQAARSDPATVRVAGPGLPLTTAARITSLPEVTGSAATISTQVVVDEDGKPQHHPAQGLRATGVTALDLGVTAGSLSGLSGLSSDRVAVSAPLAAQLHWRTGDRPTIWLADGTRMTPAVVAIFQRWRGFGDLVLPADLVARHDPVGLVGAVYLRGGPGLASAVRTAWPMLAVTDAHLPLGGAEAQNQQAAWELMVLISAGFTAIAVFNTFAVATGARRREFAGLRLAGATARQLHQMLDCETLIAVAVALVLGCVISASVVGVFSVALDGRWRLFADPTDYVEMVAGVGLLGLVAGALPTRLLIRRRSPPALD